MEVECVVDSRSNTGEGAVWDERSQKLWWVDIPAGLIHCYDPASGANETTEYGEAIGCLALRESGGLVLATRSGFWLYDPETGARTAITDPEADLPDISSAWRSMKEIARSVKRFVSWLWSGSVSMTFSPS